MADFDVKVQEEQAQASSGALTKCKGGDWDNPTPNYLLQVAYFLKVNRSTYTVAGDNYKREEIVDWIKDRVKLDGELIQYLIGMDKYNRNGLKFDEDFLDDVIGAIEGVYFSSEVNELGGKELNAEDLKRLVEEYEEVCEKNRKALESEAKFSNKIKTADQLTTKDQLEIIAKFRAKEVSPMKKDVVKAVLENPVYKIKAEEVPIIEQSADSVTEESVAMAGVKVKAKQEIKNKDFEKFYHDKNVANLGRAGISKVIEGTKKLVKRDPENLVTHVETQKKLGPPLSQIIISFEEKYQLSEKEAIRVVAEIEAAVAEGETSAEAVVSGLENGLGISQKEAVDLVIDKEANIGEYFQTLKSIENRSNYSDNLTLDSGQEININSLNVNGQQIALTEINAQINEELASRELASISRGETIRLITNNYDGLEGSTKSVLKAGTKGNIFGTGKRGSLKEIRYILKMSGNKTVRGALASEQKVETRKVFDWGIKNRANVRVVGQRVRGQRILGSRIANRVQAWSVSDNSFKRGVGRLLITNKPKLGMRFAGKMKSWSTQTGLKGFLGKGLGKLGVFKDIKGKIGKKLLLKVGGETLVGLIPGIGQAAFLWKHKGKILAGLGAGLVTVASFFAQSAAAGIGSLLGGLGGIAGGALIGSSFGPVGTVVGGILGGIGGGIGGGLLGPKINSFLKNLFNGGGQTAANAGNAINNAIVGSTVDGMGGGIFSGAAGTTAGVATGGILAGLIITGFNISQIFQAFFLPSLENRDEYLRDFVNSCPSVAIIKPSIPDRLQDILDQVEKDEGVDSDVLSAVLRVETGLTYFSEDAVYESESCGWNECGARGPMQILDALDDNGNIHVNCVPSDEEKSICENYCDAGVFNEEKIDQFRTWDSYECEGNICNLEDSLVCASKILKGKAGLDWKDPNVKLESSDVKNVARAVINYYGESRVCEDDIIDCCLNLTKKYSHLGDRSYCEFVLSWLGEADDVSVSITEGFASGFPTESGSITQGVGGTFSHTGGIYNSIDIAGLDPGAPVRATHDGTVTISVSSTTKTGYGSYVVVQEIIDGDRMFETLYGHLLPGGLASVGKEIKRGTIIGYLNSTGYSTGDHLHYELRSTSDPSLYQILLGCTFPLSEQEVDRINSGCTGSADCQITF